MHSTKAILQETLNQLAPKDSVEITPPSYNDVELTPEEEQEALRLAREKKHVAELKREYLEKINGNTVWVKPNALDMYRALVMTVSKTNKEYEVTEWNKPIISALCLYFTNDKRLEDLYPDYSRKKGILLAGPQGTGKTHLMNFFATNPYGSYSVPTCKDVAEKFRNDWQYEGVKTIDYYSTIKTAPQPQAYNHQQLGYCFGDLGAEEDKNVFGNKMNVIEEIISNRYENVPFHLTHFTTNLNPNEIKERYGVRFSDRLRESCNWLVLDGPSFR